MLRLFLILMALIPVIAIAKPKLPQGYHAVDLNEFTHLTLEMTPGFGTQLIFPFNLDDPDLQPSIKISMSDGSGFALIEDISKIKEAISGQNSLGLKALYLPSEINTTPIYRANLFITIGGYNITIDLVTNYKKSAHKNNIVFNISDDRREYLLANLVKRRIAEMEREHADKMGSVKQLAKTSALQYVADILDLDRKSKNFKKSGKMRINNKIVTVYVDDTVLLENQFSILRFGLKNTSVDPIAINSVTLSAVKGDAEQLIPGALSCPDIIEAGETVDCRYASEVIDYYSEKKLKLNFVTSIGSGNYEW